MKSEASQLLRLKINKKLECIFFFAEENFLLTSENLRASPELWPEKIPGSEKYAKSAHKNAKENDNGLTQDDIRQIYRKCQTN